MFFPEQLWIPTPKDQLAQFAPQTKFLTGSNSQVNTDVRADIGGLVPDDEVWIVTNATVKGDAAAGQTTDLLLFNVLDEGDNEILRIVDAGVQPTGTEYEAINWQGAIVLAPGQKLHHRALFSGAPSANLISAFAFAVAIPRGNWQRG